MTGGPSLTGLTAAVAGAPAGWHRHYRTERDLAPAVLRQVVALSAGSPYAVLEMARETVARGGRIVQRSTCRPRLLVRCAAVWSGSARERWPWCRRRR